MSGDGGSPDAAAADADVAEAWIANLRRAAQAEDPQARARANDRLWRFLRRLGRRADAIEVLRTLADERPTDLDVLGHLGWLYRDVRDADREIETWLRVLALDPAHQTARKRLWSLFPQAATNTQSIVILRALASVDPGNAPVWMHLARRLTRDSQLTAAIEAWRRTLELQDLDEAHAKLGALLLELGRNAEAEPHLRAVKDAPDELTEAKRQALVHAAQGDEAAEIAALGRVLDLGGPDLVVQERIARLDRRRAVARTIRISVLGNCQALGVAACLRRLLPDADILGVSGASFNDPSAVSRALAEIEDSDLVAAQPVSTRALDAARSDALRTRLGSRLRVLPRIHFTGFHPDVVWVPSNRLPPAAKGYAPLGSYHSGLIMAAFAMGLPQERAVDLFNAYVYGILGYFDEYAKTMRYHLNEGRAQGLDLAAEFEQWRGRGIFVHTPNHPTVDVFWSLAQSFVAETGLAAAPGATPPPDALAHAVRWPVYPEVASRLGVAGSMRFEQGWGRYRTELDLPAAVSRFHRAYAAMGAERLLAFPRIASIVGILRAEGV